MKRKHYKHLSLLLYLLLLVQFTFAQSREDTIVKLNGDYLLSYWADTKTIVSDPVHWKARQWSTFAGVAGIWTVAYIYDDEIFNLIQKNRSETTDRVGRYAIEPWGSGLYSVPLLAGIYVLGINNNHHRNVALTGLKAYLLSGGAAFIIKHAAHRHRPYENDPPDPRRWDGPIPFTSNHTAFPSGHTTTAFAVASVLACGYRDKPWIGITSYTIATLVGISRINDEKHWASDVVAGAALGSFIGITLSNINFKKITISPGYSSHGLQMHFVYNIK